MRQVVHVVLFVALAAGVFGLLPRLGGLTRAAADVRHARPAFMVAVRGGWVGEPECSDRAWATPA